MPQRHSPQWCKEVLSDYDIVLNDYILTIVGFHQGSGQMSGVSANDSIAGKRQIPRAMGVKSRFIPGEQERVFLHLNAGMEGMTNVWPVYLGPQTDYAAAILIIYRGKTPVKYIMPDDHLPAGARFVPVGGVAGHENGAA